jgi:trimethylamine--corrinoid protein Co-methyltransferase
MRTLLQVLSADEQAQIHERSLRILDQTGVRVDTESGRQILKGAGARVDENTNIVRFPRDLVEESLRLAPREFTLGARRKGWDVRMNADDCTLLSDGEAIYVLDSETGERRLGTPADWLTATRLIDAVDEIGVYWGMVAATDRGETTPGFVAYLRDLFANFSKHVQDAIFRPELAPWLLEVLQVVFGDKETIRKEHPLSYLLTPHSPLVIEEIPTDSYLELVGWDIPVAIMPTPLMGATGPASLISTTLLGNCEVLAALCLVQAASPGTPFMYALAPGVMDPRSGRYAGGAMEVALLCTAAVEMGRYYGVPVEAAGMGSTDHQVPSIQAGYEGALNGLLPTLSWPDILVGPGLLGAMTLSLEQLLIDVEVFRMCKRIHQGIAADADSWLEEVVSAVGPGGHYVGERSTQRRAHEGEWYLSQLGMHDTFDSWDAAGRPTLVEEARDMVNQMLATHKPLPLDEDVERELQRIHARAQENCALT